MPRAIGLRAQKIKGGKISSNVEQLAEDFVSKVQFGKSEPKPMDAEKASKIKKKFSI